MTAGMAHHLVSRAIDVTQQHYNGNDAEQTLYKFHWAAVLIFATVALYLAVISMVSGLASPSVANDPQG